MEGSSDAAGVLLALDPEAVCGHVAGVLPLSAGVDLVFGGIVDCNKIEPAILLRGLVRIRI